ncbi:hypothetical protein [Actinacidiphila acidipaludis]|uniref:Uncharacterized protein n=1 Tax=Actinacidiphila acidipaludis TaxID=2873382 RepID=A0ABS7QCK0_9ACTN|nr:hypothetical protein [Streptomyces acidipaludis]MBY8880155.1 hypothetical protein [Streptomyces acidipaludis]
MSHSGSGPAPTRRRGTVPGSTETTPDRSRRSRREALNRESRQPEDGSVGAVLTRTAELTACCFTSLAMSFLVMGVVAALAFGAYSLFG